MATTVVFQVMLLAFIVSNELILSVINAAMSGPNSFARALAIIISPILVIIAANKILASMGMAKLNSIKGAMSVVGDLATRAAGAGSMQNFVDAPASKKQKKKRSTPKLDKKIDDTATRALTKSAPEVKASPEKTNSFDSVFPDDDAFDRSAGWVAAAEIAYQNAEIEVDACTKNLENFKPAHLESPEHAAHRKRQLEHDLRIAENTLHVAQDDLQLMLELLVIASDTWQPPPQGRSRPDPSQAADFFKAQATETVKTYKRSPQSQKFVPPGPNSVNNN